MLKICSRRGAGNTQIQGASNEGQGKKTISSRVGYIDKATDIYSRRGAEGAKKDEKKIFSL
jgi:hypothetical protein